MNSSVSEVFVGAYILIAVLKLLGVPDVHWSLLCGKLLIRQNWNFFPQMMKTFPFHASYLILQYYELMQITRNKRISALENLIVLTVVITKL